MATPNAKLYPGERIRYLFVASPDTLLTLLAGAAHTAIGNRAIGFAQDQVLETEWKRTGGGTVQANPTDIRYIQIQFKPQHQNPRTFSDLRVRKALSHAIDKFALAEALLQEHGKTAELHFAREHPYFAEADRVVAKYPYDLRRADQLLTEAGLVKGSSGFYQSPNGEPFHLEVLGDDEKELLVLTDGLKRANISVGIDVLTPARNRGRSVVTLYPAFSMQKSFYRAFPFMVTFFSEGIATEANNWAGSNRGGYSTPDYDRLYRRQVASLDEDEIARIDVDLAKYVSEQAPGIPLYHLITIDAHVSALRGPAPVSTESTRTWNIHQWEWLRSINISLEKGGSSACDFGERGQLGNERAPRQSTRSPRYGRGPVGGEVRPGSGSQSK